MKIYLTKQNIDELVTNITVITFFSDEKPLKGQTGLIDWRMNGYLSDQLQKSKIYGNFKEKVLIPANSKISTSKLFLLGMGESSSLTDEKIELLVAEIKKTLDLMNEKEFAFIFSKNLANSDHFEDNLKSFFRFFEKHFSTDPISIYYQFNTESEKNCIVDFKSNTVQVYLEKQTQHIQK